LGSQRKKKKQKRTHCFAGIQAKFQVQKFSDVEFTAAKHD